MNCIRSEIVKDPGKEVGKTIPNVKGGTYFRGHFEKRPDHIRFYEKCDTV